MAWLERQRPRIRCSVSYESLNRIVIREIGNKPLNQVTTADCLRIIARYEADRKAPRTRRNINTHLHSILGDAVKAKLIEENPAPRIFGLNVDADPLWRDEARFELPELAALIQDPRIKPLYQATYDLAWAIGARSGELGALNPEHIDWTKRPMPALKILQAYSSTERTVRETKARKPRVVPLNARGVAAVNRLIHVVWPRVAGRAPEPTDPLIPVKWGKRIGRLRNDTLWHWLERDCEKLGLKHHGANEFRATFATMLIEAKVSPVLVERLVHGVPSGANELGGPVLAGYLRPSYAAKCEVVAQLPPLPPVVPQLELPF